MEVAWGRIAMSDRWSKIVGFFTVVGAIAALLVVPELREAIGLRPLSEGYENINAPIQSPRAQPNTLVKSAPLPRPFDVSDTYGNANGTIFNKKTRVAFATPEEFFRDSGRTSFVGLVFDDVSRMPDDVVLVDGRSAMRPNRAKNKMER
jgi:hypothetical protein